MPFFEEAKKANDEMKVSHTPGPWKLHRHTSGGECIVTADEKMTHIMHIQEARGLGKQATANANLAASAPQLLEALIEVEQMIHANEMNEGTMSIVRDAIAKALGA